MQKSSIELRRQVATWNRENKDENETTIIIMNDQQKKIHQQICHSNVSVDFELKQANRCALNILWTAII